jgi:hypothetical protein
VKSSRTPTKPNEATAGREAGERLKIAIHSARPAVGIDSDAALSVRAKVHYDTLMNWYAGRTVPRPAAVRQVADVLKVPYGDLMAAYDGREAAAVPLEQAVTELIAEIRVAMVDERKARADLMRMISASLAASISVSTMDRPADRE